jgi:hypothetical protein
VGTAEGSVGEDELYYKPPAGWKVERMHEDVLYSASSAVESVNESDLVTVDGNGFPFTARRQFDDDSALDFDPREEFAGHREGYIFKLGSKGLGYYADRRRS